MILIQSDRANNLTVVFSCSHDAYNFHNKSPRVHYWSIKNTASYTASKSSETEA